MEFLFFKNHILALQAMDQPISRLYQSVTNNLFTRLSETSAGVSVDVLDELRSRLLVKYEQIAGSPLEGAEEGTASHSAGSENSTVILFLSM